MKNLRKKTISLMLAFVILMSTFLPTFASALNYDLTEGEVVNSYNVTSDIVTLYVGNVSIDGESQFKYLYSDKSVNTATLTEIGKILTADYSAILPTTEGQIKACTDNTIPLEKDLIEDAGVIAAGKYEDIGTVEDTSGTILYDQTELNNLQTASSAEISEEATAEENNATAYNTRKAEWETAEQAKVDVDSNYTPVAFPEEYVFAFNDESAYPESSFFIVDNKGSSETNYILRNGTVTQVKTYPINRTIVKVVNTSANVVTTPTTYEEYNLWVGGTRVTSTNKGNILGDGKVTYNPTTHTLNFNDATIEDYYVRTDDNNAKCNIFAKDIDLIITGKVNFPSTEVRNSIAILSSSTPNISATINADITFSREIWVYGNLTIAGGSLTRTINGSAIYANGTLTIGSGISKIDVMSYIGGYEGITIEDPLVITSPEGLTITNGVTTSIGGLSVYDNTRIVIEHPTVSASYNVTVTNDGNGTASADPTSGAEGTTVTLTATPTDTENYRFKEWQVISGGVTIDSNNQFTIGTSNVEIKAIFEQIPVHTVTFKDGDSVLYTQDVKDKEHAVRPETDPKKDGHKFLNWYLDSTFTTIFKFDENEITADTPIYAKFLKTSIEEIQKESTIYAGEIFVDGESQMHYLYSSDVSNNSVTFDELQACFSGTVFDNMIPEIESGADPAPDGLALSSSHQDDMNASWTSSSYVAGQYFTGEIGEETSGNMYESDATYKNNIDTEFPDYNSEEEEPTDFSKKVLSILSTSINSEWVLVGESVQRVNIITIKLEATTVIYTKVEVITPGTCEVSFETYGGGTVPSQTITKGTKATKPTITPSRDKMSFIDWYADEELTTKFDFSKTISGDTTVYAGYMKDVWIDNTVDDSIATVITEVKVKETLTGEETVTETYNEELNVNYSDNAGNEPIKTSIASAKTAAETFISSNGYTLKDSVNIQTNNRTWDNRLYETNGESYDSENKCIVRTHIASGSYGKDTTYKSLYSAEYTLPKHTVTFMDGEDIITTQEVIDGKTATKPKNNPTKENWEFVQWCTDEDLETEFDFTVGITDDTEVYAKWKPVYHDVTITINSGMSIDETTYTPEEILCFELLDARGIIVGAEDSENENIIHYSNQAGKRLFSITETETEDGKYINEITLVEGISHADDIEYTVTDADRELMEEGDEPTFIGKVILSFGPAQYRILDGANQTYSNGNEGLRVRANGLLSKLRELRVDNKKVADKDCNLSSGSTIAVLKKEFLDTLSEGTHKLTFVYTDGEVSTNFTISRTSQGSAVAGQTTLLSSSPVTGDNIYLWVALMTISGIGILSLIKSRRKGK